MTSIFVPALPSSFLIDDAGQTDGGQMEARHDRDAKKSEQRAESSMENGDSR